MATAGVSLLERQKRYGEATDALRLALGAILRFNGHLSGVHFENK